MTASTRNEQEESVLARCLWAVSALGLLASVGAFAVVGLRSALAVAVGSGLAVGNLWLLAVLVRRWLAPSGVATAWGLLLPIKLAALMAVLYGLVAHGVAQPVPLLLGFALLPFGILIAHLRLTAANGKG